MVLEIAYPMLLRSHLLSKTKNTANIKNEDTIPKAVYMKLSLKFVVWLFKTDNSFIDKTGKTHGIKFKIKRQVLKLKVYNKLKCYWVKISL